MGSPTITGARRYFRFERGAVFLGWSEFAACCAMSILLSLWDVAGLWTLSTENVYIVHMPKGQHKEIAEGAPRGQGGRVQGDRSSTPAMCGGRSSPRTGQELKVWSTPRNPETMAKRIREFVRKYPKGGKR